MADHSRLKRFIALTRGNHAEAAFLHLTKTKLILQLSDAAHIPLFLPAGGGNPKSGRRTCFPPSPSTLVPNVMDAQMREVKKLTLNTAFIRHIEGEIAQQLVGESGELQSGGLLLRGEVRRFDISAPVVFQPPPGSGHDWRIPFTARGKAICLGDGKTFVIEGPVEGFVKIHLPLPVTESDVLPFGLLIDVAVEEAPV